MKANPFPSLDVINYLFSYDKEKGKIYWKVARSNIIRVGKELGTPDKNGHLRFHLNNKSYSVHRLIWLIETGADPGDKDIDHINGVKDDNRFENLRLTNHTGNMRNVRTKKNNSSGIKGVSWDKEKNLWYACLYWEGKTRYLGRYGLIEQAEEAVRKFREEKHMEFTNHG